MALTNINDNFQLDAPKHLDNRTGNYASVAEANASIPQEYRVQGLEVVVITAGQAVKYYYRDGVADGDLVIMPTGGGGGSVAFADITGQPSDNANLDAVLDTKGDMFKSVYDTDADGVVDKAERIEIIVRNATGSTLSKGKAVYLSGSTGNRPNAILAAASSEITATKTIGIVVADIPNNTDGAVAINGTIHNLNLSSFTAGDMLWLSNTAGDYVANTPPAEPSHAVFIGYVVRAHPTEGRMVIAIQNGYELTELHGVEITSPATNDFLYYASDGLWKNKQLAKSDVGLSNVPNTDATNPANITQSASFRFVTDTEKSTWNGKQDNITTSIAFAGSVSITITATGSGNLQPLSGHAFTINEALMPVGGIITINGMCERIATGSGVGSISYDVNGTKRYITTPSGHQYQYQITLYRESSSVIRLMGGGAGGAFTGAFGSANQPSATAAVTAGGNIVFQLFGYGSVINDQIAYRFFKAVLTR